MDLSFDITNTEGDKIKVALSYYDAETVNALLPDPFVLTLEFYDVTLVREAAANMWGIKCYRPFPAFWPSSWPRMRMLYFVFTAIRRLTLGGAIWAFLHKNTAATCFQVCLTGTQRLTASVHLLTKG